MNTRPIERTFFQNIGIFCFFIDQVRQNILVRYAIICMFFTNTKGLTKMLANAATESGTKQIGALTLLHNTSREIAGIRTNYMMLEIEYSDPNDAEWLYAVAVGEDDYKIRLFRKLGDAEEIFRIASENEIVSYVFDDLISDLGFDIKSIF